MPNLRSKRNPRKKMTTKTTAYTFPRRASTNPRNLRRKARKPMAKRKMAAARRPFVEIKARDHRALWVTMGGALGVTDPIDTVTNPMINQSMTKETAPGSNVFNPVKSNFFPLWSFMNPIQGVTDQDMTGSQMVPKYLTAKVTFTWPDKLQITNPKYYMVSGWCTVPLNLTEFTTPTIENFTRQALINHIINHVRRDFDESVKNEHLQFKPIEEKDYIVLDYRRVRPNQNATQVPPANLVLKEQGADPTMNPAVITQEGKLPQTTMTFKYPLKNRKQRFVVGTTSAANGTPFLFNNKGWIPFLLYYCPSAGEGIGPGPGIDNSPKIAYNDKTWFSDS